jgi:hypothetical protein
MSGSIVLGIGADLLQAEVAVLFRVPRLIIGGGGVIIPDCVVEETGRSDLMITEHPVEIGSVISDHAYSKPNEVTLRWSWTNSGVGEGFVQAIFAQLKALQVARIPFTLYTGKFVYTNMLFASLGETTNVASENSLAIVAVCREVIIVSTQSVTEAPQSAQAIPSSTTGTSSAGSVSPIAKGTDFGDRVTTNTQFAVA